MAEDGGKPREVKARADIQMRVVFDVRAYADVGQLMDDMQDAIEPLLVGHPKARFDFVGFNTHPCKALDMDEHMHRLGQLGEASGLSVSEAADRERW